MTRSIEGFNIVKSDMLIGAKKAVKSGNTFYVSPSMYDLISQEEGEALLKVLQSIRYIDIGHYDFHRSMELVRQRMGKT